MTGAVTPDSTSTHESTSTHPSTGIARWKLEVGFVVAVTLVAAIITAWASYKAANVPYNREHPGEVSIKAPKDRSTVGSRAVKVSGEVELPEVQEVQLWVVVRVDVNEQGTYYPQGYVIPNEEGEWSCMITLGSSAPGDDGMYKVMAVFAEPSAAAKLRTYVREELAKKVGGMTDYPSSGIDVKDSVQVSRKIAAVEPIAQPGRAGHCGG